MQDLIRIVNGLNEREISFHSLQENMVVNQLSINAYAHSGNTDDYGGHYNHSKGTYHCHSGECMEDEREVARDVCYPLGVEDAQERREERDILSELSGKTDAGEGVYGAAYGLTKRK
jgi:hypothetical protein